MKIALDIGHADGTGARGNGLEEHAVAVKIGSCLKVVLEGLGHVVKVIDYPGRSNSDDLNATIREANAGGYDVGVSLHCDCSDNGAARGGHVCYYSSGGKRLADFIAGGLCGLLPGRADKTVRRSNLAVLKGTRPVWVLVECGFISNGGDAAVMGCSPEVIAGVIADGVCGYGDSLFKG